MNKINLDGEWGLAFSPEPVSEFPPEDITWLPAKVPGNVLLDLKRAKIIPDPFFGVNTEEIRRYELYHFWYKKRFKVPKSFSGKRIELFCEGIDTFATVFLNGEEIGFSDNMLIPFAFDVTEGIKAGEENILLVSIKSPLISVKDRDCSGAFSSFDTLERLWARRPAHTYGWDIAPRLVGAGIWKSVFLCTHPPYEIKDVFVNAREIQEEKAILSFRVELSFPEGEAESMKIAVEGACGNSTYAKEEEVYFPTKDLTVEVKNPKLWWPYNLGSPNLYKIKVSLIKENKVLDEKKLDFGIRKIELLQETQQDKGRSFTFKINGMKTFLMGSNWVAVDAFHSRDKERIPEILNMVKDINCNSLRVWGGGVYEDELFYNICDQEGIMVWQDFSYACAIYPQQKEFLEIAREEAVKVIKQLRNHPSLIVWCGDNEIDYAYTGWYKEKEDPLHNKITRVVLKDACQLYDGSRPYLPSSPFTPSYPEEPNLPLEGDTHLWNPGTYFKDPFYGEDKSRFISEIGHLSCPSLSSIRKFLPGDKIWPIDREYWDHHFGSLRGSSYQPERLIAMENTVRVFFGGLPDNKEDYVLASQVVQAEAFKFWIERARQRKWCCSGILWWNLIDCWPQFSDSIVDYYFEKKLAYDYIKRSQEPVFMSLGEPQAGELTLFLINDTLKREEVNWKVSLLWPQEKILVSGQSVSEANQVTVCDKISEHILESPSLLMIEYEYGAAKLCNHYLYGHSPFTLNDYKKILEKI